MHVAILGAGALGRVYGTLLARKGGCEVSLVARARQAPELGSIRVERADGDGQADVWTAPRVGTEIAKDADLVMVTVRADQLDEPLLAALASTTSPAVVMTPMLPHDYARMAARLGSRLRAAMPGVVAYVREDGVCRYWTPRAASTLLDESGGPSIVLSTLADALVRAGLRAKLELGVHELNPATTVALAPAAIGLDAAGSIETLLADKELLKKAIDAINEGLALSRRLGKVAGWLNLLVPFVGPRMLKMAVSMSRSRWPESYRYVELHFGRKLHAQNVEMGRQIVALSKEKGAPCRAIEELLARIEAR